MHEHDEDHSPAPFTPCSPFSLPYPAVIQRPSSQEGAAFISLVMKALARLDPGRDARRRLRPVRLRRMIEQEWSE